MSRVPSNVRSERGFTLVEVLISVGLTLAVSIALLLLVKATASVLPQQLSGMDQGLQRQAAALQTDASTADAIFVPSSNEVDFFALTSSTDGNIDGINAPRTGLYWKYVYDPLAQTIQRYDYVPGGATGRRTLSGGIDATASYPPQNGVLGFSARTLSADQLGGAENAYASALQGLSVQAFPVNVGGLGITGGNQVTEVVLTTQGGTRRVHLLSGTMPSGFTLVGSAAYKSIVYRLDLTHRFFFGFAGKTHVEIRARVYISYDRWKSGAPWCDYGIYRDMNTSFSPNDPLEQAAHIAAVCQHFNFPLPKAGNNGSADQNAPLHQAPSDFFEGGVGRR